jgi:hypothetical protein
MNILLQQNNPNDNSPYFKVRYFNIWDTDNKEEVIIDGLLRDYIYSQKHYLQLNTDYHYDPPIFINFLKFLSSIYPNSKFLVSYKYEYFNHDNINTYMNRMTVYNSEIVDKIGLMND